jgi:hypothetical protein
MIFNQKHKNTYLHIGWENLGIISLPYPIKRQEPLSAHSDKIRSYATENALIISNMISNFTSRYIRNNPARNWDKIYNIVDKESGKKYICNTEYKCPEIVLSVTAIINETILSKKPTLKLFFT